jgi:hypothetical protein
MRKYFTLTLCFSLFINLIHAQVVKKGDKLFGGGLSIALSNIDNVGNDFTYSNVGLSPSFAWGINDNMVIGIKGQLSYGRNKSYSGTGTRTVNSFTFGPGIFIKKYKELKNRFGITFSHELLGHYSLSREKYSDSPFRYRTTVWGAGYNFNPGVFYKFSEDFFGEANIGGVFTSYTGGNGTRTFAIGASFLQYFNLGINYRIPRKNS